MQSVVTGQAPITLERKITSGGKQIKSEDNNTMTETNRIPQTKIKRWHYKGLSYSTGERGATAHYKGLPSNTPGSTIPPPKFLLLNIV